MSLTASTPRALTLEELGVPDFICRSLHRRGINEPFAIQRVAIADIMQGNDVCGAAPTNAELGSDQCPGDIAPYREEDSAGCSGGPELVDATFRDIGHRYDVGRPEEGGGG